MEATPDGVMDGSKGPGTSRLPKGSLAVVLIPFFVALFFFWPVVHGSFQFDDWTFGYFLDLDSPDGAVAWGEVLKDFSRPQFGIEGWVYYRPLITLNYALNAELGGLSPAHFHFCNLFYHALSSLFCAVLCLALCRRYSRTAALLGGTFFAIHPIAVEPVAWISAVTGVLEVLFRMGSLACFALHLRFGRRRTLLASIGFACLTLMCKETAVILPVSIVALDILHRRDFRFGPFFRRQLSFLPVWIAYLLVRIIFLGKLVGGSKISTSSFLESLWHSLGNQIHALLVPFFGSLPGGLWALPYIALWAFVLVLGLRSRRKLFVLGLGSVWLLLHLVPNFINPIGLDLSGSRALEGTVASFVFLMLFLALGDGDGDGDGDEGKRRAARASRVPALIVLVLVATSLPGLMRVSLARLSDYKHAWQSIDRIHEELQSLEDRATVAQPLVTVVVPQFYHGALVLNQNAIFPMLEIPYAKKDSPLFSLNSILEPIATSKELYHDAGPLRAANELGASLLYWGLGAKGGFLVDQILERPALPNGAIEGEGGRRWRFEKKLDPLALEGLTLDCRGSGPRDGYRLRLISSEKDESKTVLSLGPMQGSGDSRKLEIDLSHWIWFYNHRAIGVEAFELLSPSGSQIEVSKWTLHGRLPELPLNEKLEDRPIRLGEEHRFLRAPRLPEGQTGRPLELVVLAPTEAHRIPVESGQALHFPKDFAREVRRIQKFSRQCRFYYYFEARGGGGSGRLGLRSRVDWFRIPRPSKPN